MVLYSTVNDSHSRFSECHFFAARYEMGDHESVCDHAELKCPLKGCHETHKYDSMVAHIFGKHIGDKNLELSVGSSKFAVELCRPMEDCQMYWPVLLTNAEQTFHAMVLMDLHVRLQEFKVWVCYLGRPADRSKYKIKFWVEGFKHREDCVYLGRMYGGGDATMEYGDTVGLVLPEKLVWEELMMTNKHGKRDLVLNFELLLDQS